MMRFYQDMGGGWAHATDHYDSSHLIRGKHFLASLGFT
jgi:hypothetical protein